MVELEGTEITYLIRFSELDKTTLHQMLDEIIEINEVIKIINSFKTGNSSNLEVVEQLKDLKILSVNANLIRTLIYTMEETTA